jgi:sterol desaturase/sphingolipid hydroxylase (fatty acid hydroxylase superfamily)
MGDAVVRVLLFTALAGLAFAPLEHLFGRHRGAPRPGRLVDLGFATFGSVLVLLGVATLVGGALAALAGISREEPLLVGIGDRAVRTALEVTMGLLVFELTGYAYHRLAHAVPWLWRLHEVHHSSERMDLADGAVEAVVVVVVDAGGDGGAGAVGCDGVDGVLVEGPVVALDLPVVRGHQLQVIRSLEHEVSG